MRLRQISHRPIGVFACAQRSRVGLSPRAPSGELLAGRRAAGPQLRDGRSRCRRTRDACRARLLSYLADRSTKSRERFGASVTVAGTAAGGDAPRAFGSSNNVGTGRRSPQWQDWNPVAGFFHMATRGSNYMDPVVGDRVLRRKARPEPLPSPVKRFPRSKATRLPRLQADRPLSRVLLERRTWRTFSHTPLPLDFARPSSGLDQRRAAVGDAARAGRSPDEDVAVGRLEASTRGVRLRSARRRVAAGHLPLRVRSPSSRADCAARAAGARPALFPRTVLVRRRRGARVLHRRVLAISVEVQRRLEPIGPCSSRLATSARPSAWRRPTWASHRSARWRCTTRTSKRT